MVHRLNVDIQIIVNISELPTDEFRALVMIEKYKYLLLQEALNQKSNCIFTIINNVKTINVQKHLVCLNFQLSYFWVL